MVVVAVRGGARRSLADQRPYRQHAVALGHVLVNGVVGEAGQRGGMRAKVHLDLVDAGRARGTQRLVENALAVAQVQEAHFPYPPPTRTSRKRAGLAPCPVPITCSGWPFPQLGMPHSVQWSRLATRSHEFQNSVVMPL